MMLVYNLPATEAIYQRFAGIDGSAYFIGGFGMTALTANNIVVVPIRSGVGSAARRQYRLPEVHAERRPGTRSERAAIRATSSNVQDYRDSASSFARRLG